MLPVRSQVGPTVSSGKHKVRRRADSETEVEDVRRRSEPPGKDPASFQTPDGLWYATYQAFAGPLVEQTAVWDGSWNYLLQRRHLRNRLHDRRTR